MRKLLVTLSEAAHERLVQFQRTNEFSNLDTAVEALILRAPVVMRRAKK